MTGQAEPSTPRRATARAALGALASPASLVAVAVLLVNDQLLKSAWPGVVTGKLSDVAGLVFFPHLVALVAAPLCARWSVARRAGPAAAAVTGIGFTAVQLSDTVAAAAASTLTVLAGPSTMVADPTDLLTLPALAAALATWQRAWRRWAAPDQPAPTANQPAVGGAGHTRRSPHPVLVCSGLALAVLGTTATGCEQPLPMARTVSVIDGQLVVEVRGDATYTSTNGHDWSIVEEGGAADPWVEPVEDPTEVCAGDGQHCWRIVDERVEASSDGGSTWATAWAYPPGRRGFLQRRFSRRTWCRPAAVLGPFQIAVLPTDDEPVVVATMGTDGLLVGSPSEPFRRTAVGRVEPEPVREAWPPLRESLLTLWPSTIVGLVVGARARGRTPAAGIAVGVAPVVLLGVFVLGPVMMALVIVVPVTVIVLFRSRMSGGEPPPTAHEHREPPSRSSARSSPGTHAALWSATAGVAPILGWQLGIVPWYALAITLAVAGIAAVALVFWRRATTIRSQQHHPVAASGS